MKGKPKPGKQQIPKDNNLILLRLRHVLSLGSPRCPDHPVVLKGCHAPSSIKLRTKVYIFGISFAKASCLRFRAITTNYCKTKESWQAKGTL
jgi:hypothetical protein